MVFVKNPYIYNQVIIRHSNIPAIYHGEGIIGDTLKSFMRNLYKPGKAMFKQYIMPNANKLAKQGLESVKKIFNETKPEIEKVLSEQAKKTLKNIIEKPKEYKKTMKEALNNTSQQFKDNVLTPATLKAREEAKNILNSLNFGSGIKFIKK